MFNYNMKKLRPPPAPNILTGSRSGRHSNLVANHFKVSALVLDAVFFQYSLAGKNFAYDGEKALYTRGAIPRNTTELTATRRGSPCLTESPFETDRERTNCSIELKTFNVQISFAANVPMKPIAHALKLLKVVNTGDALRVIDYIL